MGLDGCVRDEIDRVRLPSLEVGRTAPHKIDSYRRISEILSAGLRPLALLRARRHEVGMRSASTSAGEKPSRAVG
jgi:hypothetical protein